MKRRPHAHRPEPAPTIDAGAVTNGALLALAGWLALVALLLSGGR